MDELKTWIYDDDNQSIILQVPSNQIQIVLDELNSCLIGIRSSNFVTLNRTFLGNVSLHTFK